MFIWLVRSAKEEFMTSRILALLIFMMIGALGCQPKPAPVANSPVAEAVEEAPRSIEEAPSVEESSAARAKRALEELSAEVACETADDCVHSRMRVGSNERCCDGCTAQPINRSGYEKQRAICEELGSEGCPMKKCVAPPTLACQEGRCVNLP